MAPTIWQLFIRLVVTFLYLSFWFTLVTFVVRHRQILLTSFLEILVPIWIQKRIISVRLIEDVHHVVDNLLVRRRSLGFVFDLSL